VFHPDGTDPMTRDDTTFIRSKGNVFADFGFVESEASVTRCVRN